MEPYYEKYYKHHAPPPNVVLHRETDLIASVSLSGRSDPDAIISALAHAGFKGILIDCIASGGKFRHDAENLKLYAETAEKYSIKCGLDIPCAVPGKTSRAQQTFRKQLRELLGCGATLFEVRLNNTEQMGKPEWDALYHAIRQMQPEAVISGGPDRRRGSRNGILPEFSSSRYIPRDCFSNGEAPNNIKSIERHYALGNPFNGLYYLQPECDIALPESAERLVELYLQSVGNGGVLNVRIPLDKQGRLAGATLDLLNVSGGLFRDLRAHEILSWYLNEGDQMLELYPGTFDLIELKEDMSAGERIRSWKIEGKTDNQWQTLAEGTIIGFSRIRKLENLCSCTMLRMTLTGGGAEFRLYRGSNEQ